MRLVAKIESHDCTVRRITWNWHHNRGPWYRRPKRRAYRAS